MKIRFQTIHLRPSLLQAVVDHWFITAIAVSGILMGYLSTYKYSGAIMLVGCLCWFLVLFNALYIYSFKVSITEDQIILKKGPFVTKVDYIELYRVFDYAQEQSLLQKLFGLTSLFILSGDRTCPKLAIRGIRSVDSVIKEIRQRVEYNKKIKGIYEVTNR